MVRRNASIIEKKSAYSEVGWLDAVLNRLKSIEGTKHNKDVAAALGLSETGLSSLRARGGMPWKQLDQYAAARDVSMEWLLHGRGPRSINDLAVHEPGGIYRVATDQDVVYQLAAMVYEAACTTDTLLPVASFEALVRLLHRDWLAQGALPPHDRVEELVKLTGGKHGAD